jgi:hypothetical protein
MRGFYEVAAETFCETLEHLLGMPNVTVERWDAVSDAIDLRRKGLDFADALHWPAPRHAAGSSRSTIEASFVVRNA